MTPEFGYNGDTFPVSYWKAWDSDASFLPGDVLPAESNGLLWAVLVFVFYGDKLALADIQNRGMCIPSGRIEAGETIDQTAVREVYEEVGGQLMPTKRRLLGCYKLVSRDNKAAAPRYCPVFVAEAAGFGPIPSGSESNGLFLASLEDVAEHYFFWDDLLSSVFDYAQQQRNNLMTSGMSISELLDS